MRTSKNASEEQPSEPDTLAYDNEDIFLMEALRGYTYWKSEAQRISKSGGNPSKEQSYLEAYRLILNRFTQESAAPTRDAN